jgi:hypothetical protein
LPKLEKNRAQLLQLKQQESDLDFLADLDRSAVGLYLYSPIKVN